MNDFNNFQDKSTQNDTAWENLFDKYKVLEHLETQNYFEITSEQIKEFRESRLMAKFDHAAKLPKIFKNNNLSILPISRSKYVIGHFDTYLPVIYNKEIIATKVEFPDSIESIDYTHIPSESLALNCAFNAGIIADLLDVEENTCRYTLSD